MTQSNPSLICNFVSNVKMNRNKDRRTGVINRRKTYSFNTKHKNIPESLYRNKKYAHHEAKDITSVKNCIPVICPECKYCLVVNI